MPFPGEERYRDTLAKAEGHESMSAMVKVADLKAALDEITRLQDVLTVLCNMIQGDIDNGFNVSESRRQTLAEAYSALGRKPPHARADEPAS